MINNVQHVFLIGAKSLGAYGGYETFVDKLTEYHQNNHRIKYHVACKANGDGCMDETKIHGVCHLKENEFEYHNAHCFKIPLPNVGSGQAVIYDIKALDYCCKYIKENKIDRPVIYIMACRIGPWISGYYKKIHKLGGVLYLNPDGHEWKRSKWSAPVRAYWKMSEKKMIRYNDLVICDSVNIEKYIKDEYNGKGINGSDPKTTFISYGAETRKSSIKDNDKALLKWYAENGISAGNYYLIVGRFVPENNYETIIREFIKSKSNRDLVIICNKNQKLYELLENRLNFSSDKRIKFVGTLYDKELLMKVRENAYCYLHGHEVGGTNPSLLEALGSTKLNMLLDVCFNRETAQDGAIYWNKENGCLAKLIDKADKFDKNKIEDYGIRAKKRITDHYSWEDISVKYEKLWLNDNRKIPVQEIEINEEK